ncbi:metal-dependent hydrolase [Nesterenkonia sp. NBAIMH1]|uniref:metal-dependent hydrolase n=1 Tax=Nesterenkonia sp. NBAIMH1 TaxID=2600320 RepID=UPI0011B81183|nr:metal-dependent hydrolase [Nesterenkonia sp. NBAIMH1]
MMGAHHAACGAAAGVLAAASFQVPLTWLSGHVGWLPDTLTLGFGLLGPMSDFEILTFIFVCAGAALLADADHRHATVAHSLPPVSEAVCELVGRVAGGHRNGTHSVVGVIAFTAVAWAASLIVVETPAGAVNVGAGVMTVLLASFAAKVLKFMPSSASRAPWAVGAAVGALVAFGLGGEMLLFPLAVALGMVVHIVGDMLTPQGVNWVWPLRIRPPQSLRRIPSVRRVWTPGGRQALPVLGSAGSWREWVVCVPVSLTAAAGTALALSGALVGGA